MAAYRGGKLVGKPSHAIPQADISLQAHFASRSDAAHREICVGELRSLTRQSMVITLVLLIFSPMQLSFDSNTYGKQV